MQAKLPEKKDATIGYFTTVVGDQTGWTGGLLILDRAGRPLEFQCTLPVRPSRAHEILYGPTLKQHLISEVIGKVLIKKARTPITILCVDHRDSLAIEAFTESAVALVLGEGDKEGSLARSTTGEGEGSLARSTTGEGEGSLARSTTGEGEGSLARSTTGDGGGSLARSITGVAGMEIVTVAEAAFAVAMERRDEIESLAPFYADLPDAIEPFERIREAIKEAQSQLARPSSEAA